MTICALHSDVCEVILLIISEHLDNYREASAVFNEQTTPDFYLWCNDDFLEWKGPDVEDPTAMGSTRLMKDST